MKLNFNPHINLFSNISSKEKALMTRQLATMLGSGLAIDQAFKILNIQTRNKFLAQAFAAIIYDLEQGNNLSFALSKHKKIFDPVFIAIVRSGESSGKLDKVLEQLADRLELTEDFNNKIKAAFYYPVFVVCTMIVIIVLMLVYIIPQLKEVFTENELPLPFTTRTIIWLSNFTINYWYIELIIFIFLVVAGYYFFKSPRGIKFWDKTKITAPIFKDLFVLIYMARFCRTMSMLIQSGIPIMETIAISADVIQNHLYVDSLKVVVSQVERGIPMSVPMSRDKNFPIMVSQMILVGEQTGKMSLVLDKLAGYYERETDAKIKGLASLIEPILIIILGMGVAFIVFSIIWPIYSIAQTGF